MILNLKREVSHTFIVDSINAITVTAKKACRRMFDLLVRSFWHKVNIL